MAEKPYRWTVDVEYDWGGRNKSIDGLIFGIPLILREFKKNHVKALFFISTELLTDNLKCFIDLIKDDGHALGSHGHVHNERQSHSAVAASFALMYEHYGIKPQDCPFRGPKFSYDTNWIYSKPKNHVSLLKHMWLGQKIKDDTIMYLHPFDIVYTEEKAPNTFSKLWYGRPGEARKLLSTLVNRYK